MKKLLVTLITLAVLMAYAPGCGKSSDQTTGTETTPAPQPKQVIIGINPEYNTFDPAFAYEKSADMVMRVLYDTLVTFEGTDTSTPKPLLAKDWTISDDKKTYTFNLQEGVKFSSGNALTSKDVKWSFERLANLKGNPSFLADNIKSIDTPSDNQVVISVKDIDPAFLSKLTKSAFGVLDSATVIQNGGTSDKNTDTAQNWLNTTSAGTGSYTLAEFTPNSQLVLDKNNSYWGKQPNIDKIIFKHVSDPSTQMMMLQKGDLDFAFDLSSEQLDIVKGDSNINLVNSPTFDNFFFLMNSNPKVGGPVSNPLVQQAIRYALDYEGLCKLAGNGAFTPYSIIPVGFLGAIDPSQAIKMDVEKAKSLLKEAGYPNGFEIQCGVIPQMAPDGVSFMTMAEKIQSDLAKVNIKLNIDSEEVSVYLEKYRNGKHQTNVSMWGPDFPDANNQLAFLPGQTVGLRAGWTEAMNPELADLGKKAAVEVNDDARKSLLEQIQKMTLEKGPYAVFLQPGRTLACSKKMMNVIYTPAFQLDLASLDRQ